MHKFTLLLATLQFTTLFGQETLPPAPTAKIRGFQVAGNFSTDVNYRMVQMMNAFYPYSVDNKNMNETARIGYSTGVSMAYRFNRHFSLESGLQFASKGYRSKTHDIVRYPVNGFSYQEGIGRTVNKHNFIDIPVRASFQFGKGKLQFVTSAGVSANVLWHSRFSSVNYFPGEGRDVQKGLAGPNDEVRRFNLSATVSAGVDYALTPRTHLRVEPTFRCELFQQTNLTYTSRLWNAGLNVGYYIAL